MVGSRGEDDPPARVVTRRTALALAAGVIAAGAGAAASSPTTRLVFATTIPPFAPIGRMAFEPWARAASAASGGALSIRVLHGSARGSSRTIFDALRLGVVDIAYVGIGSVPGWFRRASVTQLPLLISDARAATRALWFMLRDGVFGPEFADLEVLAIHGFPPQALHTTFPVTRLEDLRGRRISSVYETSQAALRQLRAAPVSLSLPDTYLALSQGMAEGLSIGWGALVPFKLGEVARYHTEISLGCGAGIIAMRRSRWNSLPTSVQRALATQSTLEASLRLGGAWDAFEGGGRTMIAKQGQRIWTPDAAERARWASAVKPTIDRWIDRTPQGAAIFERLSRELVDRPALRSANG